MQHRGVATVVGREEGGGWGGQQKCSIGGWLLLLQERKEGVGEGSRNATANAVAIYSRGEGSRGGISFPSADVWRVYSSMELPLLFKKMPEAVESIEIIGDGRLGTFFDMILPPGGPFRQYKEKVVRADNELRVKEVAVVEGGYLGIGYVFFRTLFYIIEKSLEVTTIRSVIVYEINDKDTANEKYASADALEGVAKAVEKYLGELESAKKNVFNKQVNEYDLPFPARDVWRVYSSMELPLLFKKMPDVLEDIQIIGDGGLGSFFINTLPPGGPFKQYKEKVVRTDHEMRVKEVAVVEGGYLGIGYVFFRTIFTIIEKSPKVTTVRSVILYEINANAAGNEKYASAATLETVAKAVEKYLGELNSAN